MLSRWRKARRPVRLALLGVTLVAFVIVATGLIALFSARPALGAQSTLTVLGGTVAVREGTAEFAVASDGQLVAAGVTIRTGPGSHAVLTYVDGTTVTIEPDSELVIEQLELSASGDLVAVVQQAFGRTWHVVQRQLGAEGRYEVRTPAATAAVRGTAFAVAVGDDGAMDLHTTEGVVAAGNDLSSVDVGADQQTSVELDTAPEPPQPAPAPQAVVRILLEPTQNAVAVDASGRSVGVQNGIPLRYAPGSKVEMVDGRLVLTIPTNEPGRISTIVQRDDESDEDVEIETEVVSRGAVVSNTTERRQVDDAGTARGGVVLTTAGVIVLPDSEADRVGAPIIGKTPEAPAAPVFGTRVAGPSALPTASAPASPRDGSVGPSGGATGATGGTPFVGAFQPFQQGGGGALIRFTAEPPRELLPPPPPSREGCAAFASDCAAGIAIVTPAPASTPPTGGPSALTFLERAVPLPSSGPSVFERVTLPGRGAPAAGTPVQGLPAGCEQTVLGVVCRGVGAPIVPLPGASLPPAFGERAGQPVPPAPASAVPLGGENPPILRQPAAPTAAPTQGGFRPALPLATPPPIFQPLPALPVQPAPTEPPKPTAAPTAAPPIFRPPTLIVTPPPTFAPAPTFNIGPLPILPINPPPTVAPAPAPTVAPTKPPVFTLAPIFTSPPLIIVPPPTPAPTPKPTAALAPILQPIAPPRPPFTFP